MSNKLFLISGHSGSGKSSIMRNVMSNEIISVTTRQKRECEKDGKDYYFISKSKYNELLESRQFVEYTEYSGNYYGLTRIELFNKLKRGHAYVIVDYNGVKQLQREYGNCVTIFLHTPKEQAIQQMLIRGDSDNSIETRISTYEKEIANKKYYDYVVLNRYNEFNKTRDIVRAIVDMETLKWK